MYIALLLSTLVFIYFYGGKVPYMLFYIVVLLPVVSYLYTGFIFVRFKYGQTIDKKTLTKGDKVNFIFSINNEDFLLYPYIRVSFLGSKTIFADQFAPLKLSLSPSRSKSFALELQCRYRGTYEVGIDTVEIEDFLGLFSFKYKVNEQKKIVVYPKIIQLQRFALKNSFISESQPVINSRCEDNVTACDVREYQYGDSLRKIHWKLTSKLDELMVKQFESTSEISAVLLIDLLPNEFAGESNVIIEDKLTEAAVAIIHYCLYNWIPVNLLFYSDGLININARNHLMFPELYEILAKVKFNQSIPAKDILEIYVNSSTAKTNILLLTSNLDYELCEELYKANSCGYDLSLVYISPEEVIGYSSLEADNILPFLPEVGITTYKMNISDDVRLVLES